MALKAYKGFTKIYLESDRERDHTGSKGDWGDHLQRFRRPLLELCPWVIQYSYSRDAQSNCRASIPIKKTHAYKEITSR